MTPTYPTPPVSVCIPVYNGERFIRACIESVLVQSMGDLELVVVDNASTDGTASVIASINDPRIRYIRNDTNIGSLGNFNKCIEEARGEYFVLLPHDDLLRPRCLELWLNAFEQHPRVGFAYAAFEVIDAAGRTMHTVTHHVTDQLFSSREAIAHIVDHFQPIQMAMAPTSVLRKLGGFDAAFGSFCDIHLWVRVVFQGVQVFYVSDLLSCHRVHPSQGQHSSRQNTSENLKVLGEHYGRTLDRQFFVENSYNQAFFRTVKFLLAEIEIHGLDASAARRRLLKHLAASHLRNLVVSLRGANGFMLRQELILLGAIVRWAGFTEVCRCYADTAMHFARLRVGRVMFRSPIHAARTR
jgi:glycosyltransferase involved in cell wall biosynthesis